MFSTEHYHWRIINSCMFYFRPITYNIRSLRLCIVLVRCTYLKTLPPLENNRNLWKVRQIHKYCHPLIDNSFLRTITILFTSELVSRHLMNYCCMSYVVRLRSSLVVVNKNVPSSLLPSIRKNRAGNSFGWVCLNDVNNFCKHVLTPNEPKDV